MAKYTFEYRDLATLNPNNNYHKMTVAAEGDQDFYATLKLLLKQNSFWRFDLGTIRKHIPDPSPN